MGDMEGLLKDIQGPRTNKLHWCRQALPCSNTGTRFFGQPGFFLELSTSALCDTCLCCKLCSSWEIVVLSLCSS